jgi:hypothetical protein
MARFLSACAIFNHAVTLCKQPSLLRRRMANAFSWFLFQEIVWLCQQFRADQSRQK